ncbi:hypothetical protein ACVIHH_008236 [Bradyrhizobium sp. USDA 4518]
MRRMVLISVLALALGVASSPARAWWDEGHMQIAYLAYKRLSDPVRDKADALLKLNKDYAKWTCGAADDKTAKMYAFIHAATWADDIKTKEYGYTRYAVTSPTAGQNIWLLGSQPTCLLAFQGHRLHTRWHADGRRGPSRFRHPAQADDRRAAGILGRIRRCALI